MLKLVHETKEKKRAQDRLEHVLKDKLEEQGTRNIGFPGGNFDQTVYSLGEETLYAAFAGVDENHPIPRYWNGFGIFKSNRPRQMITVEINIAADSDSAQVAGFFAEDTDTGHMYLMHSGKVGGGRKGIGKSAYLVWSKAKPIEVHHPERGVRYGIPIGRLDQADLAGRIWEFVKGVQSFKDQAAAGALETPEFKRRVEEFVEELDRYSKEFSGKKKGRRTGKFEYLTYHGDIVQALYDDITLRAAPDEKVLNSPLIDLFVKKAGVVSEIYEVKTGVGRQSIYTAIGQLVTHSATGRDEVAKYLVVPAEEPIAQDLTQAMALLRIEVRRFQLIGKGHKKTVKLI